MLSMKEINAKIVGVKRSTAAIRESIQTILCNTAGHAFEHGDVTAYTRLFDAASGLNRKQIVKWVQEYGFATFQKDGTFKLSKAALKAVDFGSGEQVVEYLTNESRPWYINEESAGDIEKELNVATRLKSLASQIKNAANKNTRVLIDAKEVREAMAALQAAIVDEYATEQAAEAAKAKAEHDAQVKSPLTPEEAEEEAALALADAA